MRRLPVVLLALLLIATSCGDDDDAATSDSEAPSSTIATGTDVETSEPTPPTTTATPTTVVVPPTPPEPVPSAACTAPPEDSSGVENGRIDLVSGDVDRYSLLSAPGASDPVPLVLDLHGYTEGAEIHAAHTALSTLGAAEGFAVATPHGAGTPPQWGFDPSTADIGFFDDLLDEIESTICVDRARVYAAGLSNGAMMSSILGCRLPERIAAVAPVAGVRTFDDCPIENPADWARQNGCAPEPVETAIDSSIRHVDYDCPIGGDTQLYIVEGGGHTWPGSEFLADATDLVGATTFEIDANTLIWGFFQQQWLEEPPA